MSSKKHRPLAATATPSVSPEIGVSGPTDWQSNQAVMEELFEHQKANPVQAVRAGSMWQQINIRRGGATAEKIRYHWKLMKRLWTAFEVVAEQLETGLFSTEALDWKNIILAYEPVWAIGTGETASPQQAQEMHAFIRSQIQKCFGGAIAEATSILYGGSVKPSNAVELFSQADVDGGLIGGASLQAEDFLAIVNAI